MLLLKPFSVSNPMCARWEKPEGAPIMLLSMPFFFCLPLATGDAGAGEDDETAYFLAYLARWESFLNSSEASDSLEKEKPIIQS